MTSGVVMLCRSLAVAARIGRGSDFVMLWVILTAFIATASVAEGQSPPDLRIGAAQYPDDDAVILRWEQQWTLEQDGSIRRRDHQWVKLLNLRPIRALADPRVDYAAGRDTLTIHTARTILPDGTVLPIPDYSFNETAADDVAGWPQYAAWQQRVISFSGVEPNAVLELDYEVATPGGILPWMEADLRLNEDYPTVERIVSVTVPDSMPLHHRFDGVSPPPETRKASLGNGHTSYQWRLTGLAGARGEEQSPPWQQRCGRLRFTTCGDSKTWVQAILTAVEEGARAEESVKRLVEETVKDEPDTVGRIRKLTKKQGDSFNHVRSPKAWQSLACRPAPDVLRANYGNPLESAALLLAALRSMGLRAVAKVGVDATAWEDSVPTATAFSGVVVVATDAVGERIHIHPEQGVFQSPGHWGRKLLLDVDDHGELRKSYIEGRGEKQPSRLAITGKVTVDDKGKAEGELRMTLTGLFFDPLKLETADSQKALLNSLLSRVLTGFEVTGHTVATLSEDTFRATAKISTKEPLKSFGPHHAVRLGTGPAFLAEVPLPLARSDRRTAVRLAGRCREEIDLILEIPAEASVSVTPAPLVEVEGAWGSALQDVRIEKREVRFRRRVMIAEETLDPQAFSELRQAINDLRADPSLLLAFAR